MDEIPTGRRSSLRRPLLSLALAFLGLMAIAPSANAFGLEGLIAAPADTNAGAHSDFHTHIEITTPEDQLRNLTVSLPPGLSGNPQSVPKCPVAQLNADDCPAGSQIGTTTVQLTALSLVPLTVEGSVYNVEPGPGEPARLGIVLRPPDPTGLLLPPIVQQVRVELRPDFGLDTILTDLPQNAAVLNLVPVGIAIDSIDLDLDGSFMTNPTSCGTKTTKFWAGSWVGTVATGSASFESTDCENQPYDPQASLEIDGNGAPMGPGSRPTVTSVITQAAGEANNESATVVLPAALGVEGTLLAQACPLAEFEAGTCAETYRLGSATAVSPLLDSPLSGAVYSVASEGLPQVGVDLKGTLPLKILGTSTLPGGRVATTFEGLPDLPLSRFELVFPGGPNGLVRVVGDVCSPDSTFGAEFKSQAGQEVSRTLPTSVNGTCQPGGDGNGNGNGDRVKPPKAKARVSGAARHRPRAALRIRSGGAAVRTVRVGLPRALKLRRGAARRLIVKADGRRVAPKKIVAKGRAIKVKRFPGKGARNLNIVVRPAALARPAAARRGAKVLFRIRVVREGRKPVALGVRARVGR